MLVLLLFLFPLILFTVSLYRYLQEGELSKQYFQSGVIQIFSYLSYIRLETIFMGRKHMKNFSWEMQKCFLGVQSCNGQDLLWDSAEGMPWCMITRKFIPRTWSTEVVVQIKQTQTNLFYFSSLVQRVCKFNIFLWKFAILQDFING